MGLDFPNLHPALPSLVNTPQCSWPDYRSWLEAGFTVCNNAHLHSKWAARRVWTFDLLQICVGVERLVRIFNTHDMFSHSDGNLFIHHQSQSMWSYLNSYFFQYARGTEMSETFYSLFTNETAVNQRSVKRKLYLSIASKGDLAFYWTLKLRQ